MTIEVTQADRAMATRWFGHENSYLAKLFAEHRLATRTDATPIAWTYVNEHWPLGSLGQPRYKPDDQVQDGWTEVPLYTHPPATDVAALVDIAKRLLDRGYVSKHIGEEHDDHMALVAALAPFTKDKS